MLLCNITSCQGHGPALGTHEMVGSIHRIWYRDVCIGTPGYEVMIQILEYMRYRTQGFERNPELIWDWGVCIGTPGYEVMIQILGYMRYQTQRIWEEPGVHLISGCLYSSSQLWGHDSDFRIHEISDSTDSRGTRSLFDIGVFVWTHPDYEVMVLDLEHMRYQTHGFERNPESIWDRSVCIGTPGF